MDLIWGHISPEQMRYPELKNIGLTLWPIQKTSFLFGGHVTSYIHEVIHEHGALPHVLPLAVHLNFFTRKV